jgi:hypothetical protein
MKTDINERRDPLRWPRDTLYPQKLALTLSTSGGRSIGIVRVRTKGHGVYFSFIIEMNFTTLLTDRTTGGEAIHVGPSTDVSWQMQLDFRQSLLSFLRPSRG